MNKYLKKLFSVKDKGLQVYIPKNIRHLYSDNISFTYRDEIGLQLCSIQYSEKLLKTFDKLNSEEKYRNFMYDAHYNKFTLKVQRNVITIPQKFIDMIGNGCVNIAFNRDMITISHITGTGKRSIYTGSDENNDKGAWVSVKV